MGLSGVRGCRHLQSLMLWLIRQSWAVGQGRKVLAWIKLGNGEEEEAASSHSAGKGIPQGAAWGPSHQRSA